METRGIKSYRVRGRYYSIFVSPDSYPTDLGKDILSEIPTDPKNIKVSLSLLHPRIEADKKVGWKAATIAFYTLEEKHILRLAQEDPDDAHAYASHEDFWGRGYYRKPTRWAPGFRDLIKYTIDLDNDKFSVQDESNTDTRSGDRRDIFRPDNIPRYLFDIPCITAEGSPQPEIPSFINPTVLATVPEEYRPNYTIPEPEIEFLELYERYSPKLVPLEYKPNENKCLVVWTLLRLILFKNFICRFCETFEDLSDNNLKGHFVFRQLAYGILSLTKASNRIIFQPERHLYSKLIGELGDATLSFEPPDTDTYRLDDILIILEQYITDTPNLHASIGKAIQLSGTTDTTAVIFNIYNIVIVKINHTPNGTSVSYSGLLSLYSLEMVRDLSDALDWISIIDAPVPEGILALLDVFASSSFAVPVPISYPEKLPVELCEQIFRLAAPDTQCRMESSCRLFRKIGRAFPRIGEWILLEDCGYFEYLAVSIVSGRVQKVWIKSEVEYDGWEVVLWNRSERILLEMPLFCVYD